MGFWDSLFGSLGGITSWLGTIWTFLKQWLAAEWDVIKLAAQFIWRSLKSAVSQIGHALRDLFSGNWAGLWQDIKSMWSGFVAWVKKVYAAISGPIKLWQQTIHNLYDKFFRPVVQVIDSLRVMVNMIGIFDRKLAAKLDQALWQIEAKVLSPITYLQQRLNLIASMMRATLTQLGYLDRPLLLESLRKNAAIAWHVLLNPLDKPEATAPAPPAVSVQQLDNNFMQWYKADTGPVADAVSDGNDYWAAINQEFS